jgi:methylmalonyl-CoA/ethylmalonyl-CoA epimerase
MGIQLDHIGIAVSNLPRLRRLLEIFNLHSKSTEEILDQGVRTHFFPLPEKQVTLELLEPLGEEGAVSKFVKKRGFGGVHHLSFRVDPGNLESLCIQLRKAGFDLIYDAPRLGAHGMRINFIHPRSTDGVLIEVMEPAVASQG